MKTYDDKRIDNLIRKEVSHLRKEIRIWQEANEKAIDKAHVNMEKRLDAMNEFRATLEDQASRFVTRRELLSTVATIVGIMIALATLFVSIFFKRR